MLLPHSGFSYLCGGRRSEVTQQGLSHGTRADRFIFHKAACRKRSQAIRPSNANGHDGYFIEYTPQTRHRALS